MTAMTVKKLPLVSVVILNHNYGRYLGECIDSALSQDHAPLEVIVVDDGSTDESRGVIDSYGARVIGVLKPNGGVASTMNKGFEACRGDIVIFLDADDFLLPGAIGDHVRAHGDPRVVRSQVYLDILDEAPWPHTRAPGEPPAQGDLRDLVLQRGPGAYVSAPQSGNAWARRYLECVLPLPENLKGIGADALLMDTAPLFGTTVLANDEPRAVYRVHDRGMNAAKAGGMTTDNIRRAIGRLDARSIRLEQMAVSLGHRASRSEWRRRNWRLLTLDHLSSRIARSGPAVPMATHLVPAWRVRGSLAKRLTLALTLLCIRLTPLPLSLQLAGRIINLRFT
jgi:glycosyltransferase involved in cell wall biosynthesis